MEIFDLHTHILPEVDDGARTIDDALQMLRNAVASDVTHLVVTPHYCSPYFSNVDQADLRQRFLALCEAARDIPVQLYFGAEVHITDHLPKAGMPTLNDSRYLLSELPLGISFSDGTALLKLLMDSGYLPIIAHPERYDCICREPELAEQWLDMGCHLQLTAGSILGKFGKPSMLAARKLLQLDLVACVASDAHGPNFRTNYLAEVYNHLQLHFGPHYARILMWENPQRICSGQSLNLACEQRGPTEV